MASLLGLARAEQERAKRLLGLRLYAHGATLLLGLASLALPEPWVYVAAVAALVTEGLAWWLRTSGLDAHGLSESARRRALVEREFGRDPDSLGSAALMARFSDSAREHALQWDDPHYYATGNEPGRDQLRLAIQESAFYSSELFRSAARRGVVRLGAVVAVVVIAVIAFGSTDVSHAAAVAARVGTVVLATLITVDELGFVLSQFEAARVAADVVRHLDDKDSADLARLLVVFADYSVANALGSPIPTRLYNRDRSKLEAAWRLRRKGTTSL